MPATDTQLKTAYELNGMSPEEIATEMGFDVVAVKAKLMQVSSRYRKDCGAESDEIDDGLNFTKDQLREVNKVIHQCATAATLPDGTPDYRTMLKAATYVRDDKKGRKEVVKATQNTTFNVLSLNEAIQAAREGAKRVIGNTNGKAIEA